MQNGDKVKNISILYLLFNTLSSKKETALFQIKFLSTKTPFFLYNLFSITIHYLTVAGWVVSDSSGVVKDW